MELLKQQQTSTSMYWLYVFGLACCYFIGGTFGLSIYITEGAATLVWPPTGFSIAAILIFGPRIWPGIALGALSVNIFNGLPTGPAVMVMTGNTLEALAIFSLFLLFCRDAPLTTMKSSVSFSLACLAGCTVSASMGILALWTGGLATASALANIRMIWWLGDVMGGLLIGSLIFLLARDLPPVSEMASRQIKRTEAGQRILLLFATALLSIVFYWGIVPRDIVHSLLYLPGLIMLLGAVFYSQLVTITQCFIISSIALMGYIAAGSPEVKDQVNHDLFFLYAFMIVLTGVGLWLSSAASQWRAISRDLEQANEEALEASRQKNRFLANMSHEIRTPLNGIIGMTSIMMGEKQTSDNKEKLRIILGSADSLLHVLNDALDYTRIEAGKLSIEEHTFNLHRLINDVSALFKPEAAMISLYIKAGIDTDVPETVKGDSTRIRQILTNLISNSLKFTEEGGIDIHVRLHENGTRYCVEVTDTGIGIPPDAAEHIFEPFTQADSSTSRQYGGAGLGLTISKLLADQMGGTLTLETTEGRGSCFTICLPLVPVINESGDKSAAPLAAEDPAEETPAAASKSLRILVIEDNPTNTLVAQNMLNRFGHQVETAINGKEGIEVWQQHIASKTPFDVILMDCHMPVMDGYKATRAIRLEEKQKNLPRTPIVALTADAQKQERQHCLDSGMDDYITKPVRLETLQEGLEKNT